MSCRWMTALPSLPRCLRRCRDGGALMKAERARLKRLNRLERVRAMARQAAAIEAAEAESALSQLQSLAERTRQLAAEYAARGATPDGAALAGLMRFAGGMQQIHARTSDDAHRARVHADGKLAELGQAERRRAVVEDRAAATARTIATGTVQPVLGARKALGTPLE